MISALNQLNIKYDNLPESKRFSVFLLCIAIPLSVTMAINVIAGMIMALLFYVFRVTVPYISRKKKC